MNVASAAELFVSTEISDWKFYSDKYSESIELVKSKNAAEFRVLDDKVWNLFPKTWICSTPTVEELGMVMEYKLTRGSFRPKLHALILTNSKGSIEVAFKDFFKNLKVFEEAFEAKKSEINDKKLESLLIETMKPLLDLSAVGPATASLLLSMCSSVFPFFADEAYDALYQNGFVKPIGYTVKHYVAFCLGVWEKSRTIKLSPREVSQTLWACAKLKSGANNKKKKVSR